MLDWVLVIDNMHFHVQWPKRRLNKNVVHVWMHSILATFLWRWVFFINPILQVRKLRSREEVSTNRKRKSLMWPQAASSVHGQSVLSRQHLCGCDERRARRKSRASLKPGAWDRAGANKMYEPGSIQPHQVAWEPKGYKRQAGWASAVLHHAVGTELQGAKRHPLPAWSPQQLIFGQILDGRILKSVFNSLAYPSSLNELLHILLYWIMDKKKTILLNNLNYHDYGIIKR